MVKVLDIELIAFAFTDLVNAGRVTGPSLQNTVADAVTFKTGTRSDAAALFPLPEQVENS